MLLEIDLRCPHCGGYLRDLTAGENSICCYCGNEVDISQLEPDPFEPKKKKFKVCLCDGCIKEAKYKWPYILPKAFVKIKRVATVEECDNYDLEKSDEILKARNPEYF